MTPSPEHETLRRDRRAILLVAGIILAITGLAGFATYRSGRDSLLESIDRQLEGQLAFTRESIEEDLRRWIHDMESWARQPVMVHVLDADPDHEIAELLGALALGSQDIVELSCADNTGRVLASSTLQSVGKRIDLPPDDTKQLQRGTRFILTHAQETLRATVPIFLEFDEREYVGMLQCVLKVDELLARESNWWTALTTRTGIAVAQRGQDLGTHFEFGTTELAHPQAGRVMVRTTPIAFPPDGRTPSWNAAIGEPLDALMRPIELLFIMCASLACCSATLTIATVLGFYRRQRALVKKLAAEKRERSAVAKLGQTALGGLDLKQLMEEAAALIADAIDVPCCGIWVSQSDDGTLILQAGVGWNDGVVGTATEPGNIRSPQSDPSDPRNSINGNGVYIDPRFEASPLLAAHRIRSGISTDIPGRDAALGLVSAHTTHPRLFAAHEADFLRAIANVLAAAIERHETEAELRNARRTAEAASRSKGDFLANMSHEIRTPMTAILGFAETLLDSDVTDEERLNCVHTIRRNGRNLLGIINDILDLSKIEAGKMTMEQAACEPCRVIAEVVSLVRVQSEAKNLPLKSEFVGTIPEVIQSDPTRLRQILINLFSNAIKFTESGCVRLVTQLIDNDNTPRLQFDVIDTGLGMTAEQVDRLFRPFTQADTSTTRNFGGTGLGLTISKRFAEMLGGDVSVVRTEMNRGSTIRATVATGPLDNVRMLDDPTAATTVVSTDSPTPRSAPTALQGVRLLLVEDGPDNQRLVSAILKRAGAEVTVEENGRLGVEAVTAAREDGKPFDVILMDMQMPIMDGYQATTLLRQRGIDTPIIALTAHAMTGDRQQCIDAGCDDYASKPINRKQLIEIIESHCRAVSI